MDIGEITPATVVEVERCEERPIIGTPARGYRCSVMPCASLCGMQRALRSQDTSCLRCSEGDCRRVETFGDQPDAEEYLK